MNYQESIDVIASIMRRWEQAKTWTEEHAGQWVEDLAPLDFDRSLTAVKDCARLHHFPPSWAQFHEAYRAVTFREIDPSRNPPDPSRALGAGYLPKAENVRRLGELRKALRTIGNPAPHSHGSRKVRTLDEEGNPLLDEEGNPLLDEHGSEVTTTIRGPLACPVCSQHDWNAQGHHKPEHCARCKHLGAEFYASVTKNVSDL